MSDKKTFTEIIAEIDALWKLATPGDWERDFRDTHSAEATFACVIGADGQHLFGAENSEVIQIESETSDPRQTIYWDDTGKRNFDLACALKNNWERVTAEVKRMMADGCVIVPEEPTEEMVAAGARGICNDARGCEGQYRDDDSMWATWRRDARHAYRAMIAAGKAKP